MRLSEWRKQAPIPECVSAPVSDLVDGLLRGLGVGADADCWVIWGEDPGMRYTILAPSLAGMATVTVRPMGGAEGPRGNGKLTRWSKLNVSELAIEAAGGHRIVAIQVESIVLKGVDADADGICDFVRVLLAGMENRAEPATRLVAVGALDSPALAALAAASPLAVAPAERTASTGDEGTGSGVAEAAQPSEPSEPSEPVADALAAAAVEANSDAPGDDDASDAVIVQVDDDAPQAPDEAEPPSREEVAAKRRATAAAILLPDIGPVETSDEPAAAPEPAPPAAPEPAPEPAPGRTAPAAAAPESAPAAPVPPAPAVAVPPMPSRDAWVPPHPIVEAEPVPPKPRRWNP